MTNFVEKLANMSENCWQGDTWGVTWGATFFQGHTPHNPFCLSVFQRVQGVTLILLRKNTISRLQFGL